MTPTSGAAAGLRVLVVRSPSQPEIGDVVAHVPGVAHVEIVDDFDAARAELHEDRFDIHFFDLRTGSADGLELISDAHDRLAGPIVVVACGPDPEIDGLAAAAGAFDCLDETELDVSSLRRTMRYARATWEANAALTRYADRQRALADLTRSALDVDGLDPFLGHAAQTAMRLLGGAWVRVTVRPDDATRLHLGDVTSPGETVRSEIANGEPWGDLVVGGVGEQVGTEDVAFLRAVANLMAAVIERKKVSATRDRLVEILEATPDVVGTMTVDGTVTYLNRAGRGLRGDDRLADEPDFRLFYPPDIQRLLEDEALPLAAAQGWWAGRTRLLHHERGEIPVSEVLVAHRDDAGRVTHFSAVCHDLTDDIAAERALTESRALIAMAFEGSPIGKAIVGTDGAIISANHALEDLVGCGRGDLVGVPAASLAHPQDLAAIEDRTQAMLDGGAPFSIELRLVRHDRVERWVSVNASLVEPVDGVAHVVLQIQDVTERREASDQIRFQASLLDQVNSAVVATDLSGVVTYWNRTATAMFGYSPDEVLGRPMIDLVVPDPDVAAAAMAEVAATLATGGTWEGEASLQRKDGSTFLARMSDSLFYDDTGTPIGVIGTKADITRLREIEAQARRQESVAASVLRSVQFPVVVLDHTGVITAVNRAWTRFAEDNGGSVEATGVGVDYLEVARRAAADPVAAEAVAGIERVLAGTLDSFLLEYECSSPDEERWFEMEVHPIPEEGVVVVHSDITAERLHRRALQETIEAKDRFIASLSHELRTPLTAVVGLAEELRAGTHDPADVREFHALIADQAGELSLLVDDLLVAARLESGTITYRRSSVVVADELHHVLAPWRVNAGFEFEVDVPPDLVVTADPGRLRQILRNLVSNAVKYGRAPFDIRASAAGADVVVTVSDHGAGIPADAIHRLFQPYASFASRSGLTSSVGLGLSVSRDLAVGQGGTLDYRRDGEVTVFELRLPMARLPEEVGVSGLRAG